MKELSYDAVIIGGGAAGMAAALELEQSGFSAAIIEREDHLGGILMQCIHNGFGLHLFNEELTGPEFAERFMRQVEQARTCVYLNTTVLSFQEKSGVKELFCVSPQHGVMRITAKALLLAMGCRERNRGNVRIPGSRPAGVFTAGLAQRLVNIEGWLPGKEAVVIGSGDIGLIMARRMTWAGCTVKAVVEIMPYPAGLTRNIVQCLRDFDIPLYLSCQTTNLFGNDRVEGVEVTPMENGVLMTEKRFRIDCDTVLLSVGLVPENELSREAGVELSVTTGGPVVDSRLMTTVDGVFACGNVLHVHDLVDFVVEEARMAAERAAAWLRGDRPGAQIRVKAGANVRYVSPAQVDPGRENRLSLRSLVVKNDVALEVFVQVGAGTALILSQKKGHVQPSEMINVTLGPKELGALAADGATLEVSLRGIAD